MTQTLREQALYGVVALVLATLLSGVRPKALEQSGLTGQREALAQLLVVVQVTALVVASLLWLRWNGFIEGKVLWSLNHDHGITQADTLVIWPVCRVVSLLRRFRAARRIGSVA
jgi:hypothetical protein